MLAERILPLLSKVKGRHPSWMACCPAHDDRNPSLSIADKGDKLVLKCFAGCPTPEVVAALGLSMSDLFADSLTDEKRRELQAKAREEARQHAELVRAIAQEARARGKRLSQQDKDAELAAWQTLREAD